jgi:oxygen-independent coproporphyrinogen III oxidase
VSGIYIHIPFCYCKCRYCDFYSVTDLSQIDDYIPALIREISICSSKYSQYIGTIATIYIGGGTPSLLSTNQLSQIIDACRKNFHVSRKPEITIECNPGTVSLEKFREYKAVGVSRISLGVQSFNDNELQTIGRIHTAKSAEEAVRAAQTAGFDNINIDLMFSIPNQTIESWIYSLNKAISFNLTHVSTYSMTIEKNTPIWSDIQEGKIEKIDEEIDALLYEIAIEKLIDAGFYQYEVSNFAKAGKKCLHNLGYWKRRQYIGFGASAHSYIGTVRRWNHSNLDKYLSKLAQNELPIESSEKITKEMKMMEAAFLGLRSVGLIVKTFQKEFSIDLNKQLMPELLEWKKHNMVKSKMNAVKLTSKGYTVCNQICTRVLNLLDKSDKTVQDKLVNPQINFKKKFGIDN